MRNIPPNLPTVLLPLDELDHDAFGPEDESEAQARVVEICDPNGCHIELRQWFR